MQTPSTPSPSPTWCVLRSEIPALEFAFFDLKIEIILCYSAHLPLSLEESVPHTSV